MIVLSGLKAEYARLDLNFKFIARTSRGAMMAKETYFIRLTDSSGVSGIGECPIFRGLSAEDSPDYQSRLAELCRCISLGNDIDFENLSSSLRFGLESAYLDLQGGGNGNLFDTPWVHGEQSIAINGLVWMGTKSEMFNRIKSKLNDGFNCLKLKIGGIDFESELDLLRFIRSKFSPRELELRLDANGAFSPDEALVKLGKLSCFAIHSIEQPIKSGQWEEMARICAASPIPVALDEELIGISDASRRETLLSVIKPRYVILKPSLCGGLKATQEWIASAAAANVGWWLTSALESNVGLNAIAQLASTYPLIMPQGLGTGQLYYNNIPSPLRLKGDKISYDSVSGAWDYESLCFYND